MKFYSVIYDAIEDVENALKGMLKPEYEEVELGTRGDPPGVPFLANSATSPVRSSSPVLSSAAQMRAWYATASSSPTNLEIVSLRREKDDVTEVREGFECGIKPRPQGHR